MPNHVDNELRVFGPAKDVKAFVDGLKRTPNKEGGYAASIDPEGETLSILEAYVPMPPEFLEANGGPTSPLRKEDQEKGAALQAKYGASDWYEWCSKNWGTKWGDYDTSIVEQTPTKVRIDFNSAWSPPVEGISQVALQFPSLVFDLRYWEAGAGFKGRFVIKEDVIKVDESREYRGTRGG